MGALSQELIVSAAVSLLDELGERRLTFRLLAKELNTGPGALDWHVSNKDGLVALAADQVLGHAFAAHPSVTPISYNTHTRNRRSGVLRDRFEDGDAFHMMGHREGMHRRSA
ncbi:TetR family transcriptional regulator [Streptomyces sp. NPDC014748]|uniref:TetR family transcriptional regulator n=1 Tax=Streptomyces sp. NPDC014748 TaxID=3364905 RepID=UPI0036FA00DE